ncbi:MAG: hypothetical protein H6736_03560 [Alphaproteobacteria bacterium]|nr:hypothetical protein [Alphaproteobacteria bacterium]
MPDGSLLVGAPTDGFYAFEVYPFYARIYLVQVDADAFGSETLLTQAPVVAQSMFWDAPDQYPPHPSRLGRGMLLPGDLDGDGEADLILLDDTDTGDAWGNTVFVPGPFEQPSSPNDARQIGSPGVLTWIVPGVTDGTPCGDIDQDGDIDLCLDAGVMFSPLDAASTVGASWGPGRHLVPLPDPLADGGVLLYDAATGHVGRVTHVGADGPDEPVITAPIAGTPVVWAVHEDAGTTTVLYAADAAGVPTLGLVRLGDTAPLFSTPLPEMPTALALVDVDGDDIPDPVIGAPGSVTLRSGADLRCTTGTLTIPWEYSPAYPTVTGLWVGDVDGGGPELIVGNPRENRSSNTDHGAVYVLHLPLVP